MFLKKFKIIPRVDPATKKSLVCAIMGKHRGLKAAGSWRKQSGIEVEASVDFFGVVVGWVYTKVQSP